MRGRESGRRGGEGGRGREGEGGRGEEGGPLRGEEGKFNTMYCYIALL